MQIDCNFVTTQGIRMNAMIQRTYRLTDDEAKRAIHFYLVNAKCPAPTDPLELKISWNGHGEVVAEWTTGGINHEAT